MKRQDQSSYAREKEILESLLASWRLEDAVELIIALIAFSRQYGHHALDEFADRIHVPPIRAAVLNSLVHGSSAHYEKIFERQIAVLSLRGATQSAQLTALALVFLIAHRDNLGNSCVLRGLIDVFFFEIESLQGSRAA
jgi:hypothetical protein